MFKKLAFGLQCSLFVVAAAITTSLGGCGELFDLFAAVQDANIARERAGIQSPNECRRHGPSYVFGVYSPWGITCQPRANWSGPHVGASGGGGKGHSNQTDRGFFTPTGGGGGGGPVGDGSFSLNGGLIGGGGGYDLQYAQWVFGLEADYSWADINGSSGGCGAAFISHTCSTGVDSLGTFRGRIGYPLGMDGSWLLYATGGLAYGELKGSDSLFNASGSEFRAGYTVGGGVEKALAQHWTVKGEYLYVDLGHATLFNAAPGVPETVSFTSNIFRVGMNYKFY